MSDPPSLSSLFDEFPPVSTEEWEAKIREDLGREPDEHLRWESIDGVSLPAFLRRNDLGTISHVSPDATASPLASTNTSPANDWRIRQDIEIPDPDAANREIHDALDGGVTDFGLSVFPFGSNFDGLPIKTTSELNAILHDVPLEDVAVHLGRGPAAVVLYCALKQIANDRNGDPHVQGSVGYDPVAALATGSVQRPESAFDLAADLIRDTGPLFRSVTIDTRVYHDAGAAAFQELAYGLSALSEVLSQGLERGVALSTLVADMQFLTAVSTSYFVEIAKLRALRLLVPQVVDAYADERNVSRTHAPSDVFIQTETSRRTETIYAPHVNMLRGTTAAMAAALGGCDVLSVHPYDAQFEHTDTAFGARFARNVQHLLQHEAHVDQVSDPAAGAYYVEAATDQLARKAWSHFQEIEAEGGIVDALEAGLPQEKIQTVRQQRVRAVDDGDYVLVGTNHYPNLQETRLEDVRSSAASCNNGTWPGAESPDLSLSAIRSALETGRTFSELTVVLTEGPVDIDPLPRVRIAKNIEDLRLRTERYAARSGDPPSVFLVPIGPTGPRSTRAKFARHVFGVAGFEVVENLHFEGLTQAAEAAAESDPDIVVLCSADSKYADLIPKLRSALSSHGLSPVLVVAGRPDQMNGDVPADDFIHHNAPLREKLESLQDRLGILNAQDTANA